MNFSNYQQKLLQDLNLDGSSEQEKQQALEILGERLHKVIIYTVLERLSAEQKQKFSVALANPGTVEDNLAELAAEVPGLDIAIEQALLVEYDALRNGMKA